MENVQTKPTVSVSASWLQQLLTNLLLNNKDQVVVWLENDESVVFDAFAAVIGSKSTILAALLASYKTTVMTAVDAITLEVIDKAIATLQQQQQ